MICFPACGCCCGCLGCIAIILAWALFVPLTQTIYDVVEDSMFIDNPGDGNENPLAESKQYNDWIERDDGANWVYSVFTVTNAEDVVNFGSRARVQELGPISTVQFTRKLVGAADTTYWTREGIARYRTQKMNYLNNATCLEDCLALLETSVVAPNPVWAQFVSSGLEIPLIFLFFVGSFSTHAAAAGVSDPTLVLAWCVQQMMGSTTTSLGIEATVDEAQALLGVATDSSLTTTAKVASLATFMAGAQSGAGCTLGTLAMTAPRCTALVGNLTTKVTATLTGLLMTHASAYATGSAAPVFLRVTVRQLLAFESTFADPMTGVEVKMPAALNYETPTNVEMLKMSSRFGEDGTGVFVGYNGVRTDCSVDRDCCPAGRCSQLTSRGACALNPPANCHPMQYHHRSATAIPGQNFGTSQGYARFGVGTKYDVLINGVGVEMELTHEGQETVDGKPLKYLEARMSMIHRRLENCVNDQALGYPGFDCDGPLGTYNYGPLQGAPFYVAMPMFETSLIGNYSGMNAGQGSLGWDPTSRVDLMPCQGSAWCDHGRPEKFRNILRIEPETGKTFRASISVMLTQRITASAIHTNMLDAVVPVFMYRMEKAADGNDLSALADLQVAPAFFDLLVLSLTIAGGASILFGYFLCCFGAYKGLRADGAYVAPEKVVY